MCYRQKCNVFYIHLLLLPVAETSIIHVCCIPTYKSVFVKAICESMLEQCDVL
jgi:hypothetical protein